MDNCFIDVTLEFLAITFHNILYFASVYPQSIFERRKKYNIVVYRSLHPEVNQYIDLCLKSIAECLHTEHLSRVEFIITDQHFNSVLSFIFEFDKKKDYDETADAYLIQAEQNIRAFCLKLATMDQKLLCLPEDTSFSVRLHTNESTAVALASNPEFEEFPFIEIENDKNHILNIVPLRKFSIRHYNVDTYIEKN